MPPFRVGDDPAGPCILARRAAMEVLVRGSHLLDRDDVSVARTTIPQAGGLGLRSFAPTEGESATPVCRPGAVIVTHDGLGFAVAECDEVGGHSTSLRSWRGLNPAHGAMWRALLIIHFWSLRSATKQDRNGLCDRALHLCSGGHANATALAI